MNICKKNKINIILIIFSCYYIYDEFTDWSELGENIKYIVIGVPLAIALLIFSYKNKQENIRFISIIGIAISLILLIPPFIIYELFIK